jgi:hypothetical protein
LGAPLGGITMSPFSQSKQERNTGPRMSKWLERLDRAFKPELRKMKATMAAAAISASNAGLLMSSYIAVLLKR